MKTVILAAGIGQRLLPLTEKTPKTLLSVGEYPILHYQLKALDSHINRNDIFIITGHGSDYIKEFATGCNIVYNEEYNSCNNIYSLFLVKEILDEESFILLNSDVLFDKALLDKLIYTRFENSLIIDDYKNLGEEEMKVKLNKRKLTDINKTMDPKSSSGEYIGLAKFSKNGADKLFKKVENIIEDGKVNEWYERAIKEICNEMDIYGISTDGLPWIEIDNHQDLQKAHDVLNQIKYNKI
ncbi:choline kinase [Methanofollis sp. W23]|uniref:phosphocholine cytidylyltransferase family protein n=1 Tax=Methanofollis sp. W23 TaxID=2817849 RepID=UPI001AE12BE3|nr:phosphocholine cytidylyltransferase family protein [Methanofollis sp. W23]MBP2144569.1 choline kinase [Methanofollis sp. W23]